MFHSFFLDAENIFKEILLLPLGIGRCASFKLIFGDAKVIRVIDLEKQKRPPYLSGGVRKYPGQVLSRPHLQRGLKHSRIGEEKEYIHYPVPTHRYALFSDGRRGPAMGLMFI
ncbi:hypothetical protein QQP08_005998 [Theobroma cacao]|nr:hypothetical protein QQP08_005998 [Theobroma cacao]